MKCILPPGISSQTRLEKIVFCALDLETTGTNPALHKIVEIGMVKFTLHEQIGSFDTLVDPQMLIPDNVINIHGITNEMVKGSPLITEVISDVYEFIADSILVIHNPRFDLSFLKAVKTEELSTKPVLQAFDTVRMSRKTFPGFTSHKLESLCATFEIDIDSHHRALSDANGCKEVFKKTMLYLDPEVKWTLADLYRYHGSFIKPYVKRKSFVADIPIMGMTIGLMARIRYKDSNGTITIREIVPRQFIKVGKKHYVYAYCNLRKELRYFKVNRILEVI